MTILDEMPDCPERRHIYDISICKLNDKQCLLDGGYECEIYNDWLKEVEDEIES